MHLQFNEKVQVTSLAHGGLKITAPWIEMLWNTPSAAQQALFRLLVLKSEEEEVLVDQVGAEIASTGNFEDVALLYHTLSQLKDAGLLAFSVFYNNAPLCTLAPLASTFQYKEEPFKEGELFLLSRFCFSRRIKESLVLETSLEAAQILLQSSDIGKLLDLLSRPSTLLQLSTSLPSIPYLLLEKCLQLFKAAKIICSVEEGISSEERDPLLSHWEFHDLLFHNRSRRGKHSNPLGATYPFIGKWKPLPAVKSPNLASGINLYKPDIEKLKSHDLSFTRVLENRASQRKEEQSLLTVEQLGEFLFRAARVQESYTKESHGESVEHTKRTYPSGGALHSLEIYPVIHQCSGIERGIYHYHSHSHQLAPYPAHKAMETMLKEAAQVAALNFSPQILFIISSRFQRVSWKYSSIAYALILKEVGALMQTMYLVASAMELSCCALGMGNASLFSELIHSNYFEESSVGEFMLT